MALTDLHLTTLHDGSTRLDAGPEHAKIDRSTIATVQTFTVDVPLEIVIVREQDPYAQGRIVVDGATASDRVVALEHSHDGFGRDYAFRAFEADNMKAVSVPVADGRGAAALVHGHKADETLPGLDEWDSAGTGFWYRKIEARTLKEHFERAVENEHLTSIVVENGRFVLDGTSEFETLKAAKQAGDRWLRELGPEFGKDQALATFGIDPETWEATFEDDGTIYLSDGEKWMLVQSMDTVEIGERDQSRTVTGPAVETATRYGNGTLAYDPVDHVFRPPNL